MARSVAGTRTVAGTRSLATRDSLNNNLVPNGDFEIAPTFVAATTTNLTWIDGTASGNVAQSSAYNWGYVCGAGTGAARFDSSVFHSGSNSLKTSLLSSGAALAVVSNNKISGSSPTNKKLHVPVSSSTSYTLNFWMKTNYVSGDSTRGAYIRLGQIDVSGNSLGALADTTYVKTTTNWTQYTVTATTGATTKYLSIDNRVESIGANTLVMDAWFDDESLRLTIPVTRTTA